MEYGRFRNGLRWSACSSASSSITPMLIRNSFSDEQCTNNDNYLITFPDESDADSPYDGEERSSQELDIANDAKLLNRYYENPLFIPPPAEVLKGEISEGRDTEELMKSEAKNFGDYKFCEAVNDFDIELEAGEAVPIVYLSTTRAARLERSLRLAGYKKVSFNFIFLELIYSFMNLFFDCLSLNKSS